MAEVEEVGEEKEREMRWRAMGTGGGKKGWKREEGTVEEDESGWMPCSRGRRIVVKPCHRATMVMVVKRWETRSRLVRPDEG